MSRVVFAVLLLVFVSSASAQVIYEPVRYQYGEKSKYYYGGSDPRVHACEAAIAEIQRHERRGIHVLRVYTDVLGLNNAALWGYTPADAANEAYASVPRYFVKRDLLNAAVRVPGAWVVPAEARPIRCHNQVRLDGQPLPMPKPLLIIPKDALQPPAMVSDKLLVAAR